MCIVMSTQIMDFFIEIHIDKDGLHAIRKIIILKTNDLKESERQSDGKSLSRRFDTSGRERDSAIEVMIIHIFGETPHKLSISDGELILFECLIDLFQH